MRISPKLHRKAALLAIEDRTSLNSFVAESIRERIIKENVATKKGLPSEVEGSPILSAVLNEVRTFFEGEEG